MKDIKKVKKTKVINKIIKWGILKQLNVSESHPTTKWIKNAAKNYKIK